MPVEIVETFTDLAGTTKETARRKYPNILVALKNIKKSTIPNKVYYDLAKRGHSNLVYDNGEATIKIVHTLAVESPIDIEDKKGE